MTSGTLYLSLREAGKHIGRTERWMRRHWPTLVQQGVKVFRLPPGAVKGRLVVERASLETWMEKCRITADFGVVDRALGS